MKKATSKDVNTDRISSIGILIKLKLKTEKTSFANGGPQYLMV